MNPFTLFLFIIFHRLASRTDPGYKIDPPKRVEGRLVL